MKNTSSKRRISKKTGGLFGIGETTGTTSTAPVPVEPKPVEYNADGSIKKKGWLWGGKSRKNKSKKNKSKKNRKH